MTKSSIKNILCLFDKSGIMGKPYAEIGCNVLCIDWEANEGIRENILFERHDLRDRQRLFNRLKFFKPDIVFSFPDCTDLAVSGAKHFEKKRKKDPGFQRKAIELFETGEVVAKKFKIPSFTENPVSVASSLYRKPDDYFHPYEYGGYLPGDDVHPIWPEYISPRDAYPKKTSAWLMNLKLPPKKPVYVPLGYSTQQRKLGGKSQKTKDIRSMTPRGFSIAMFEMLRSIKNDTE